MANRYANLVGSNKIKDEWQKINTGFDLVQADMDEKADASDLAILQGTVTNHIGSGGNAHAEATDQQAGFMSATDKQKLDGIEEGAQVNQNAFAKVNDVEASDPSDELTITGGTGITVTTNPNTKEVIVTATGSSTPGPHGSSHTEHGADPIPNATTTEGGLMSAADKTRLDGATSAATPNTLVQRDPAGRFKAAAPVAADDVARKADVDAITTEKINTTAYRPATEDGSTYPIGVTSFAVSNGLSDGWPTDLGVVSTTKLSHIRCLQIFMASSATGAQNGRVYVRSWRSDSGWSDWRRQWDSQEMGAGSGLDADLLDGLHASNFWTKNELPYETGGWTPELRFGNETTGITYTDRFGRYTRIGNVVFWELDIVLSSKGTASGDASIAGLPFTSSGSRPYFYTVGGYANITLPSNATGMVFFISNNSSIIFLRQIGNGIHVTETFTDEHFTNTSYVRAQGFYYI